MASTPKQKKALKNMVENGGNISKAMRDAGYSATTAHTPQKLTASRGWKELIQDFIPDDLLVEKHLELLTAKKANGEVDVYAVKAGLDMAYKIKGLYVTKKDTNAVIVDEDSVEEVNEVLMHFLEQGSENIR